MESDQDLAITLDALVSGDRVIGTLMTALDPISL